jgi:hypothetical protein
MDDGSLSHIPGATIVTLATMGFAVQDCEALRQVLGCFGVEASLHKNKSLYVRAASINQFMALVAPYVLREFDYKLPERYRLVPKENPLFVVDDIERVRHVSVAERGNASWEVRPTFKLYKKACRGHYGAKTESFDWKYDLTVEDNHNFFVGPLRVLVSNSKCAKHAFLSELVKVNQYRKRFHATSDSLEKFMGAEDHAVDKHDMEADMKNRLADLTCRWGHPQEIGCIRYLIDCLLDEDNRDKQAAIRAAAYCWGVSLDMSKYFYRWALSELRTIFIDRIRVPITEDDLLYLALSYDSFVEVCERVGIANGKTLIATMGGTRVKIPTLAHIIRQKESYRIWQEIERTDKNPDAIAEVAARHKKTPRGATEMYEEMCEILNPRRAGEYYIYKENDEHD